MRLTSFYLYSSVDIFQNVISKCNMTIHKFLPIRYYKKCIVFNVICYLARVIIVALDSL